MCICIPEIQYDSLLLSRAVCTVPIELVLVSCMAVCCMRPWKAVSCVVPALSHASLERAQCS
eukprot:1088731-Pelagomonas_calceolata.AAC.1